MKLTMARDGTSQGKDAADTGRFTHHRNIKIKHNQSILLIICLFIILLLAGCKETNLVFTISPDGSCSIRRERTFERLQVEMYVNKMEAGYARKKQDGDQEEQDSNWESMSADEKLKAKFIKFASRESEDDDSVTMDARVNEKTFTTIETHTYEDVETFIQEIPTYTGGFGMVLEDEDGNLKVSMAAPPGEWGKYTVESLKGLVLNAESGKSSIKLVLPGKVISSELGQFEKNTTWFNVDSKEKSSGTEAADLLGKNSISIVCEMGGLNASLPMSSFELVNAMEEAARPKEPELPITHARPGYLIMPYLLRIIEQVSYTQDSQNSEEQRMMGMRQDQGVNIYCNMYAPKNNVLIALESVKTLSMTDDRGSVTKVDEGSSVEGQRNFLDYVRVSTRESQDFQIMLPLPDHKARALETVECEAVVLVAKGWDEASVTGPWANPETRIDLSKLVPGAYMTVKKLQEESGVGYVADIEVIGPPEIHYLFFSGKKGRSGQFDDNTVDTYSREFVSHGEMVQGNMQIVLHSSKSMEDLKTSGVPFIAIYPNDLRRERVKFTLKGLDLM